MNTCFMKKLLVIIVMTVSLLSFNSLAQTNNNKEQNKNVQDIGNYQAVRYKLYPTQNMWTFIKLNTRNGVMTQVQYDVNGNNRGECSLNSNCLVPEYAEFNGRFDLYPTQNMWTFILLDHESGYTWQVQWSTDAEKRMIVPMN
jgi:hypothetical protein